jgi:hypothetical protein
MTEPVPPLSLSDLKMRLRYGELHERLSALEELAAHGAAAAPIMADVAEQFRLSPQTFPSSSVTKIYLATRSPELLSALRSVGNWDRFNTWERCDLLEAGVDELEPPLRDHLARNWERPGHPERGRIVEALGRAGSAEALEYLSVIEFRLAERVRTERLRLTREKHDLLEEIEHRADAQLLSAVKESIEKVRSRIETGPE